MELEITVEGVETQEQLSFLQAEGDMTIQCFYFARPMPEHDLVEWMASEKGALLCKRAQMPKKAAG